MADDLVITLDGGDWLGVILAAVAAFFVGMVWFTFLFGKKWGAEMGIDMNDNPGAKVMAMNMAKDVIGHLLMAYVLFHATVVWLPELWAEHFTEMGMAVTAENGALWMYGLYSAGFTWLGYFLPTSLTRTGWEMRSWTWFGIDAGYNLVKLVVMAQIIVAFA